MPGRVVIKISLDEELYRRLEERAREQGYALVVDYIREVLAREATAPPPSTAGIDERRLAEAVARRVERVVADLVNPFTGKIDEVSRRLAELIERMEEGAGREVEPVREKVEPRPSGRQVRGSAMDRLRQQKVVFWDDVEWMKAPDKLFLKLEREGAIVLDVGGEKIAVDRGFWEEFVRTVEEIGVRDPDEAATLVETALGERARRLFEKLVSGGFAYYDEDLGRWMVPQP